MTTLSRAAYAGAALLLAGGHLLQRETWQAIGAPYQSFSFSGSQALPEQAGNTAG